MSIHIMTLTNIHCDGPADRPCPEESFRIFSFPQMIALRMARKEGWQVDELTVCPKCVNLDPASPEPLTPDDYGRLGWVATRPIPLVPNLRRSLPQATSLSIGSSSAS